MASMEEMLKDIVRQVVREEIRALVAELKAVAVPEILTVDEAADVAKLHHTTIREWVKDGSLPASRAGARRGIRIKRDDLMKRLASKSTAPVFDLDAMADQMLGRKSA